MDLSPQQLEFLEENHSAAMITVGSDGMPKAVRIGVALVDGRLWASGRADSVRVRRLRDDGRCTLFVFDSRFAYLTLETMVRIIDQPEAVESSVKLFRSMQRRPAGPLAWFGQELDDRAFRRRMVDEARIVFEFQVELAYGITRMPGS